MKVGTCNTLQNMKESVVTQRTLTNIGQKTATTFTF